MRGDNGFREIRSLKYELWGLKVLWWGRIGKVLQLFAAFVVVLEILGPESIRLFAGKLRGFEGRGNVWMLTTFMIALAWIPTE